MVGLTRFVAWKHALTARPCSPEHGTLMAHSPLVSLAILKVNWDHLGRGYLDNFIPLIGEALRLSSADVVSVGDLQQQILDRFGLEIPRNSLRSVLHRAAKKSYQYVVREQHTFKPNRPALEDLRFEEIQSMVLRHHRAAVRALVSFVRDRYDIEWADDEAEAALLSYLEEHDLDVMFAVAERTTIPTVGKSPKNAKFLVSIFVSNVEQSDPRVFEYLETVVKGNMLANALFLPDPKTPSRKFRRTVVYLDTPVLIAAVGYAGEERRVPAVELLELLYDSGASLCCLRPTLEELQGILDACAHRIRSGQLRDAYGDTIEYFLARGCSPSDVDLLRERLPAKLRTLKVALKEKPPYRADHQIDEASFEAHLQTAVHYRNPDALRHDVDAISAIVRLRRGRQHYRVEDCHALFVTSNTSLSRAASEFFQSDARPGAIPPCITDFALTNLLWLKDPTAAADLPRHRIIADAYAAMRPPEGLWSKYLAEIAKLQEQGAVSEDDYIFLRHSHEARTALMDVTYGDEAAFIEGTVAEIRELAQERLRADLKAGLEAEAARREAAEAEVGRLGVQEEVRMQRLKSHAQKVASIAMRPLTAVALLAVMTATFPWSLPPITTAWLRYLATFVEAAVFIVATFGTVFGWPVTTYLRRAEVRLAAWIERRLIAWFG